jgi:hypothetical protein
VSTATDAESAVNYEFFTDLSRKDAFSTSNISIIA